MTGIFGPEDFFETLHSPSSWLAASPMLLEDTLLVMSRASLMIGYVNWKE